MAPEFCRCSVCVSWKFFLQISEFLGCAAAACGVISIKYAPHAGPMWKGRGVIGRPLLLLFFLFLHFSKDLVRTMAKLLAFSPSWRWIRQTGFWKLNEWGEKSGNWRKTGVVWWVAPKTKKNMPTQKCTSVALPTTTWQLFKGLSTGLLCLSLFAMYHPSCVKNESCRQVTTSWWKQHVKTELMTGNHKGRPSLSLVRGCSEVFSVSLFPVSSGMSGLPFEWEGKQGHLSASAIAGSFWIRGGDGVCSWRQQQGQGDSHRLLCQLKQRSLKHTLNSWIQPHNEWVVLWSKINNGKRWIISVKKEKKRKSKRGITQRFHQRGQNFRHSNGNRRVVSDNGLLFPSKCLGFPLDMSHHGILYSNDSWWL